MTAARVLVADLSPVFTLWQVRGLCAAGEPRVVWSFQSQGGDVTPAAADSYFGLLEERVAATAEAFVTLYDFTVPLRNFLPFAAQFARSVGRLRGLLLRQVRTVVICESRAVRNILRLAIGLVGGTSPYVIVSTVDAGWREAFAARRENEAKVRDGFRDGGGFGGGSRAQGLDPCPRTSLLASASGASEG